MNYCQHCGKKIKENQDVCLSCGKSVSNNSSKIKIYKTFSGIISIILGGYLELIAEETYEVGIVQGIGFLTIIAGILTLCSNSNNALSTTSGIFLIICFIGITLLAETISIFSCIILTFGVLNTLFSKNNT